MAEPSQIDPMNASDVTGFHELIEHQVRRVPDRVAVVFGDQRTTYRQLDARANQLAHHLRSLGVGTDVMVGICVERSIEMMVALLGILKAGGAYLPLDPGYPRERLAFIVEDAGLKFLVTQQHLLSVFLDPPAHVTCLDTCQDALETLPTTAPLIRSAPHDLAYVIYTSGSTGKPKGVMIPHRAVANLLRSMRDQPGLRENDRLLAVTTISFDIAVLELYLPLVCGASTLIASREMSADPGLLARTIKSAEVTVMQATPATWRMLVAFGWTGEPTLRILCGGEALGRELTTQLLQRGACLWNLYGPTETTVWSMVSLIEKGMGRRPITLGVPIANTDIHILDENRKPVPPGGLGELYIGGIGLARGYLHRPELTEERFVPHPLSDEPGARLYRTGDLVRCLAAGGYEFVGRIDHQVKIRGHRVELGEIEATLEQHAAVGAAVVIARKDDTGDKRLDAYVVTRKDEQAPAADETDKLSQWHKIWNDTYQQVKVEDPTFNIGGWNSTYTGLPLTAQEMHEWVDHTVARILSLRPRRLLEIGCGTGLLLFRIAERCVHYCGTDISEQAILSINRQLASLGKTLTQLTLMQRAAHSLSTEELGTFDTVVLNSVVQYFPNVDYLVRVLEGAAQVVPDGGSVFVGDVRSLPLVRAYHTSVLLHQARAGMGISQLRSRIEQRLSQETGLCVDPAFFRALQRRIPRIREVEIQVKRGHHNNEMNRFRYDVVLRMGDPETPAQAAPDCPWVSWQDDMDQASIRRLLETETGSALGLRGVPDPRTFSCVKVASLMAIPEAATSVDALRVAEQSFAASATLHPEHLWALEKELPYAVFVNGSGAGGEGTFDVLFRRIEGENAAGDDNQPRALAGFPHLEEPVRPLGTYANQPALGLAGGVLTLELRHFLRGNLPDYMMPSSIMFLDTLPLTPSGKVDRRALPLPHRTRPDLGHPLVAPRDETETQLASIWAQTLGLDQVGVFDNFFDLGGNSLQIIHMLTRINEAFHVNMPIVQLFETQTVTELANAIRALTRSFPS